jgi:hypothetical protein
VVVTDGLRSGAAGLAASAAVMIGCVVAAAPAVAAGDASQVSCPAATESSPGFRASLPDCRAYEIVSESNSEDTANVVGSFGFPDGAHVYYNDFLPTPAAGARSGLNERFLATRTLSGWTQQAVSPSQGEGPMTLSLGEKTDAEGVVFSGDFSEALAMAPFQNPFEDPRLNQTTGVMVYDVSLASGAVAAVSLPDSGPLTQGMIEPPGSREICEANGCGEFLAGGSADGSRAFFVGSPKLATAVGSPADTHEFGNEIYERRGGHTYLVGILPDGSVPACGADVGQGMPSMTGQAHYSYGAIAPSGTNIVFGASNCSAGGLYLRNVVEGTTVQLPGSLYGGRAGTRPGEEEKILTLGEGKVYEYHVGSGQTAEVGSGDLLTYSPSGARVYSLGEKEAIGVYEEGGPTRTILGTEAGGYRGGSGNGGGLIQSTNLTDYAGDTLNMPVASGGASNGSHLLFIDSAKLTEYENEGHFEAYVYDADTEEVTCISCSALRSKPEEDGQAHLIPRFMLDAGELPYQTPSPPFISDDGSRAVFETTEALVPQDVDGTSDVYEWAREGTHGCEPLSASYSPVIGGCDYLLSSGLGTEVPNENGITGGTHLVGASENLQDVYIQTSESLLPGLDDASKLYDVRVDGGFPYTVMSRGCEPGRCRAASGESPVPGKSTTDAFAGPGDVKTVTGRRGKRAALARRRRLALALRACGRRHAVRRRIACERRARRRYGMGRAANRRDGGGSR